VEDNVGGNALRLAGEVFVPGAAQLLSGRIGSGLAHNLLAGAAGVALIGTGVAPVLGGLAILVIKLNSYTSAVSGRSLWDISSDAVGRRRNEAGDTGATSTRPSRSTAST